MDKKPFLSERFRTLIKKTILSVGLVILAAILPWTVWAQSLADIGVVAPVPGTNDISQLSTNGNQQLTGTFKYFTDNANPPGQTFTTGTNALVLNSVSIRVEACDND